MNKCTEISEAVNFLQNSGITKIDVAIILGSGLGDLAEKVQNKIIIPYKDIPNFPVSTVSGHKGQFVYGELSGKKVLIMQGRIHFYEGYSMQEVTFPTRVITQLGAKKIIITNAAGGVNTNFKVGDFMVINDHINYMGTNPLIGPNNDELGERFPDMTNAYPELLRNIAFEVAEKLGLNLQEGVYMAFTGPTFETPAEIRMVRTMGADAVGMSTVPEVIVAVHGGLQVLGISCITNLAAGMQTELSNEEVIAVTERVKEKFIDLVSGIVEEI